jgi:hypothetical protein
MDPQDYSVTFRIRHPSIDPAEITRRLGFEPLHAWRAGDPRALEPGDVGSGVHRETYWVGVLPAPAPWTPLPSYDPDLGRSGPLAAVLTRVAKTVRASPTDVLHARLHLMKRAAAFWRGFCGEGGTLECRLQVNGNANLQLDLSQALLALLVELKVALTIELDAAPRAEERVA